MLPVHASTIRLFLHVLGATVWIGGQIALAALVPVVRANGGSEATRAAARRFQMVAWPAFALLIGTGIWNLLEVDISQQSSSYQTTLAVKLVLVVISGFGAFGHTALMRRNPALGGAFAGIGLLAALAAAFMGILLQTG
jgi:putative copper export protein